MSSGVTVRVAKIQLSIFRRSQKQVRVERSGQSSEEPKQQIEEQMTFHWQRVRMGISRNTAWKHIHFEMSVNISLNFSRSMELQELLGRSNNCLSEEDYHVKSRRHVGVWDDTCIVMIGPTTHHELFMVNKMILIIRQFLNNL